MFDEVRQIEFDSSEEKAVSLLLGHGIWKGSRKANLSWAEMMLNEWLMIVEEHSSRNLTKIADRLVTLQGLADTLEETTQRKCVFGLWCHQFPRALQWKRAYEWADLERAKILHEIGILSWSWASKVGTVGWWDVRSRRMKPIATISPPANECKALRIVS
jgi:hypothetical protein